MSSSTGGSSSSLDDTTGASEVEPISDASTASDSVTADGTTGDLATSGTSTGTSTSEGDVTTGAPMACVAEIGLAGEPRPGRARSGAAEFGGGESEPAWARAGSAAVGLGVCVDGGGGPRRRPSLPRSGRTTSGKGCKSGLLQRGQVRARQTELHACRERGVEIEVVVVGDRGVDLRGQEAHLAAALLEGAVGDEGVQVHEQREVAAESLGPP